MKLDHLQDIYPRIHLTDSDFAVITQARIEGDENNLK
jgi:hypothetical protein